MVRYVLDSTVLIDHLRGHEPATEWLTALEAVPLCSEVSRTEVLVGVRADERGAVETLFRAIDWVPVDEAVARRAGELGQRFRTSHRLGAADLLIAATVEEHRATLATSNVRHFPMFPELRSPY